MKKGLIIKTSSLGDVVHTLPAVTDAVKHYPELQFDWVVEPGFAEIPLWHKNVAEVIHFPWRKWRKNLWTTWKEGKLHALVKQLRATEYDIVIDAQGLVKSGILAGISRGKTCGYAWNTAREPLASIFYDKKISLHKTQHAVPKVRELFAQCFGYEMPSTTADYGIDSSKLPEYNIDNDYVVLLHGTTWDTKHWPEAYWQELAQRLGAAGITPVVAWGNQIEHDRAAWLKQQVPQVLVLPKLNLSEVTGVLSRAKAVVAVDTGLGHIAAALAVPTISLYGPTDPNRTGTHGSNQIHLAAEFECAPCLQRNCSYKQAATAKPACFGKVQPEQVWNILATNIGIV